MCGRYSLAPEESAEIARIVREVQGKFGADSIRTGEIRPTNPAPVLVPDGPSSLAPRPVGWGFPRFDGKGVVINARAETALDKPMFRKPLLERRCVIPTTGFYEWDREKRKYLFRLPDSSALYLAGFWNSFREEDRFIILTTAPNDTIINVHDRMPVLLPPAEVELWLRDTAWASEKITARQPDLVHIQAG